MVRLVSRVEHPGRPRPLLLEVEGHRADDSGAVGQIDDDLESAGRSGAHTVPISRGDQLVHIGHELGESLVSE